MAIILCAAAGGLAAQTAAAKLNLRTGKDIYLAGCAGCHGPDGKGLPETTVGFEKPETFPDFTRCDQTTPERDVDWRATIHRGGHGRGFSPIMPSFSEALNAEQIDLVIGYVRGFCKDKGWPRGELNLPRALTTEKAFPESETVVTGTVNAQGAPGVSNAIVYERRLSARNQLEVSVPFGFTHDTGRWLGGVGDIGVGLKRVLFSSRNTIVSGQGEVIAPTGDKLKGLGSGVTVFEAFVSFAQLLPHLIFVQAQAGTEQPTHTETAPRVAYWRGLIGKSFRQDKGLGRMWSPMVEWVADHEYQTGAKTNWDVVPQFQVTLSKRQHVRANAGVRIPMTNTAGRPVQVVFYVLWDWFDGRLLEGWH